MESKKGKKKEKTTNFGLREKENGERNAMFTRVECGLCKIVHKNALASHLNYPCNNIYNIIAPNHARGCQCPIFIK